MRSAKISKIFSTNFCANTCRNIYIAKNIVKIYGNMRITESFPDPMDRQLQERVNITNFKGAILMNRRNEMGGVRVERMRHKRWGGV